MKVFDQIIIFIRYFILIQCIVAGKKKKLKKEY